MTGNFNPRPREEGDGSLSPFFEGGVDFNPRPREEGDLFQDALFSNKLISIHALVKRATPTLKSDKFASPISIHALVKRATP